MAASGLAVYGQPGPTSQATGSGATGLDAPGRPFVDEAYAWVWIPDRNNNRVLVYTGGAGDTGSDLAISREADTASAGTAATDRESLSGPIDVAFLKATRAHFLAVADAGNNRILVWIFPSDSSPASVLAKNSAAPESRPLLVLGQSSFTSAVPDTAGSDTTIGRALLALAPSDSGDTVYLFASLSNSPGKGLIVRYRFRDTFSLSPDAVALDTAGGTPRYNLIYGSPSASDTTPGTSARHFSGPAGIAVRSGSLYVADRGNHRLLRFDTATRTDNASKNDTQADAVWGQRNFTESTVWTAGSDTGLRNPVDVRIGPAGLAISDSPTAAGSGRVLVYDGLIDTKAARWFGMDASGNPLLYTGVAATTVRDAPALAVSGTTLLAASEKENRVLLLTSVLQPDSAVTPGTTEGVCLLSRIGLPGPFAHAARILRDVALRMPAGRLFVRLYALFSAA